MDEAQQRRIAVNEDHCRQANQAIHAAMERFEGAEDHSLSLVCECGISECKDSVAVSLRQYAEVRANPIRFIVRPDHVIAQVEMVSEQHPEYWVIEKVGAGADEAASRFANPNGS